MSTLTGAVQVITIATLVLVFLRYVLMRGRSTAYQSTRLVIALIVLVAVLILMTITLFSMLQVSGSLTK